MIEPEWMLLGLTALLAVAIVCVRIAEILKPDKRILRKRNGDKNGR